MGRLNLKSKVEEDAGVEFVNRRPDGGFLLGVAGFGDTVAVPQISSPRTAEEIEQAGERCRLLCFANAVADGQV